MRTNRLSRLRFRLGVLMLLAFVPMAALTVYTDLEERDMVISYVEGDVQQIAQFASGTQEQLIDGARQLLVALAKYPEVQEANTESCNVHFAGMMEEYPRYANLGVIRRDGVLVCAAVPVPDPVNFREQSWFLRAWEKKDLAIGAGPINRNGQPTLNLAYPVLDASNEMQGVVFAAIDLDELNQVTGEVQLPEKAEFFMIAHSGMILAYLPEPDKWVGKVLQESKIVKSILSKGADVSEFKGLDGVSRLYAFTPVRSTVYTGLSICFGIPTSLAYSEANAVLFDHMVLLGCVAALALLAMWYGSEIFILRRVNALVAAAQKLSGGDMKARTGLIYGSGELDQLARTFDEMAEALDRRAALLYRAEAKYRTLVEQVPVITYATRLDDARATLYVSPQVQELLGYTPEECMDDPEFWIKHIHPDDLGNVKAALFKTRSQGEAFRCEYRIFSRARRLLWFSDAAVAVQDEEGDEQHLQGIMKDVTEHRQAEEALRESEERFRLLVECVRDYAIFMLDTSGCVESWNSGAERIKGYKADEIIGRNYCLFHTPEDVQRGAPAHELEHASANGRFENEGWRVRKDGSRFWANVIITALHDDAGATVGYSMITRDLTEHKRAQEQLMIYQEQLRSLASQLALVEERERRRIAVDLHDRVGQALAMSKIRLGVLKESASTDEQASSIEEVRKMIEQAIQDTRSLIFKISSPILYELGFEAALEWLAEQLQKEHGIEASFLDDGTHKPLDEDIKVLLFQAASELLVNVAKHSGAKHVSVSARKEGGQIHVCIEDDGIGFDVSGLGSHSAKTYGFGLFSIRERLRHVSGRLEVRSKPGDGTRIAIVAPLSFSAVAAQA
ncbi:MAG: PAS domain S-box protein [Syntrophobacteraceae bacterium]